MGYTTSTIHGIEVPDSSEANNVPEDIGKVVTALEAGSLARRLTGAQIAALTAPQKPAGLLVYNTTTNRLQISDGTNFADLVDSHMFAVGVRTTNQTIPAATTTTLTYTADTDAQSMLNAGTGVLTVPLAGLWLFTARISIAGGDNYMHTAQIRGVSHTANVAYLPVTASTLTLAGLHLAAAGDTFDVTVYATGGTNVGNAQFAATLLTRT